MTLRIPYAKPGRDSVKNDVIGMDGIPGEDGEEPYSKKIKTAGSEVVIPYSAPFGVAPTFGITPFGLPSASPWIPSGNTQSNQPPIAHNPQFPAMNIPQNRAPPIMAGDNHGHIPSNLGMPPTTVIRAPIINQPVMSRPPGGAPHGGGSSVMGPPPGVTRAPPVQSQPHSPPRTGSLGNNFVGRGPSPQLFPIQSPPHDGSQSPTHSSQFGDGQKSQSKFVLVYDDPEVSTEEKRAMLDRHKYPRDKFTVKETDGLNNNNPEKKIT